jgi:hypothetical protein
MVGRGARMSNAMINRLKRLVDWIPVIWNDYDYDYSSLYVIMRKKLSRMEDAIRNGWAVDSEATADKIHFAVMLLDRLIACNYLENALIPHKRRWGDMGEMILEPTSNPRLEEWKGNQWEGARTEKERLEAEEEFRIAGRHSDWVEERDKNLLFEHISKHIRSWWD